MEIFNNPQVERKINKKKTTLRTIVVEIFKRVVEQFFKLKGTLTQTFLSLIYFSHKSYKNVPIFRPSGRR